MGLSEICDVGDCEEETLYCYCNKHYWEYIQKTKKQTLKEVLDLIKRKRSKMESILRDRNDGRFKITYKLNAELVWLEKEIKKLGDD